MALLAAHRPLSHQDHLLKILVLGSAILRKRRHDLGVMQCEYMSMRLCVAAHGRFVALNFK